MGASLNAGPETVRIFLCNKLVPSLPVLRGRHLYMRLPIAKTGLVPRFCTCFYTVSWLDACTHLCRHPTL